MPAILNRSHWVSVAPSVEPVSVSEAKRNCDVDYADRDADFERWIKEARAQVELDSRRALINQTHVLTLDAFPSCDGIELPFPPLSSVSSLKYYDTTGTQQTWDSGNYTVDTARTPGVVFVDEHDSISWPSIQDRRNAVEVTYIAGYGSAASDIPESAKNAILLLVKHRFEHPEMWTMESLSEVPDSYRWIISGLRWGSYP